MALVAPETLFPGMTVSSTGITIPFSALGGLTQAEADPTTGNAVKVLYELLNIPFERYAALASSAQSARITFSRGNLSGNGQSNLSRSFALAFTLALPNSADVADEPA